MEIIAIKVVALLCKLYCGLKITKVFESFTNWVSDSAKVLKDPPVVERISRIHIVLWLLAVIILLIGLLSSCFDNRLITSICRHSEYLGVAARNDNMLLHLIIVVYCCYDYLEPFKLTDNVYISTLSV